MIQPVALVEFEALFKKHHKGLCDFAYNLVKDKDAAKDIVQEVFFKFWKNRQKIETTGQLKSYLFKATSHTSLNYLRSIKRIIRLDHALHLLDSLEAKGGTEDAGFKDLETRIQQAIERLPPKCKVIYQLSRQEDLSNKQIAETLNLSIKTIENQITIALEKLRNDLKPFLTPEFILLLASLALMARLLFQL
jgi:RNA polymerase sigma-70 factor, ECF subfamily